MTAITTVREILEMKRERLVSISPTATVFEALRVMAEHEIGALIVLDGGRLVGVFSERDYARRVALQGRSSRDTPVVDVMTSSVFCVRPEQTVEECMALMTRMRVRHLPVLQDSRVIGVVSIGDVVREVISDQSFVIEQLEDYIVGWPMSEELRGGDAAARG
jgi:CBS domain-containing protein